MKLLTEFKIRANATAERLGEPDHSSRLISTYQFDVKLV